jgi:hypothetical protein
VRTVPPAAGNISAQNCLLRTAKTDSNSSDPIAQLMAKHDIHTCAVIFQTVRVMDARQSSCFSVTTRAEHVERFRDREGLKQAVIRVTFKVISAV